MKDERKSGIEKWQEEFVALKSTMYFVRKKW